MSHQDWKEINIGRRPGAGASAGGASMKQAKDPKAVAAVRARVRRARGFGARRRTARTRGRLTVTWTFAGASRGDGGADGEEGCADGGETRGRDLARETGGSTDGRAVVGDVDSGEGRQALKLELDDENLTHKTVSADVKKAILQGRLAKGLTQAQLAQQINEKPQVVQEYESGKAIPNQQILAKLERILGVKLRGKGVGK